MRNKANEKYIVFKNKQGKIHWGINDSPSDFDGCEILFRTNIKYLAIDKCNEYHYSFNQSQAPS